MRSSHELTFRSFDQAEIFYRSFPPSSAAVQEADQRRAVVMFHRGHEHSGRMAHTVEELNLPESHFFAWDQRGHGKSPGERGYASHAMDFVRDIDAFIQHIKTEHGFVEENITVIAHSVSAVLVAMWVKSYAPRIRGMVLATPAFQVKLYVPFALPALRAAVLAFSYFQKPPLFIKSYVKGKLLTHSPEEAHGYDTDPLISKQIAANILVDLFDMSAQVVRDAGAITVPTLVISARADWVVKNLPQRRFYRRLSSTMKRVRVFRGFYHAVFHEQNRGPLIASTREFIEAAYSSTSPSVDREQLRSADTSGYTYEEFQWLEAGLPMLSWKRLGYVAQRASMRSLGSLSNGIKLGWQTGFDSGQMLDYVYRNEAQGEFGIGKIMDRTYLDSVGWVGIRQRKLNIEKFLKTVIDQRKTRGGAEPIRIVDIAGGPARYVLDVVRTLASGTYRVLIRDWSEEGLEVGRGIAAKLGVTDVEYKKGDAFSRASLDEIGACDVLIVSGLYELYPENANVRESLSGIAQQVKSGGFLIYTNQPWHPQLEMIAEVLNNREHRSWIMRRRTQAEIDELVREAGFRKVGEELDNAGIFTVSLAVRA